MSSYIMTCVVLALQQLAGATGTVLQPRICTTVNCQNEHIEVIDGIDGVVHRYSNNAANFHEAHAPRYPTKEQSDENENRLDPVSRGPIRNQPYAVAAAASITPLMDQHVRPQINADVQSPVAVSVVGGGNGQFSGHPQPQGHMQSTQSTEQEAPLQPQNAALQQLPQQRQQSYHHQLQYNERRQSSQNKSQVTSANETMRALPTAEVVGHQLQISSVVQAADDGVFWSTKVEDAIPPGLSDPEVETWLRRIRQLRVIKVENASREKCGSDMNRHVVFEDGTTACARYRHPMVHFVLGDTYCYYLARILGMHNVPTVVLSRVSNDSSSLWSSVAEDIRNAGWVNDTVASFSLWIENLGSTALPEILYVNQHETISPSTPGLTDLNLTQLVELAQYSDLIIFDYITAHLDRMTIRKNAVEYYQMDWLYQGEVHNLAKHKSNGGLWFIDNENGIFNAYSVAYGYKNKEQMQRYHEELLRSMCIFRRSTVDAVRKLAKLPDPYQVLDETVHQGEPVVAYLSDISTWQPPSLRQRFKQRIENVASWVDECKLRSSS